MNNEKLTTTPGLLRVETENERLNDGNEVIVNGEQYVQILEDFLIDRLFV